MSRRCQKVVNKMERSAAVRRASLPRTRARAALARAGAALERPAQRELEQAGIASRVHDLSERAVTSIPGCNPRVIRFDVRHCRIREVGVVPDVKEVRGETNFVALTNLEILD